MPRSHFEFSTVGLVVGLSLTAIVIYFVYFKKNQQNKPSILFSDLSSLEGHEKSFKQKWMFLPHLLKNITFALFIMAMANPTILIPIVQDSAGKLKKLKSEHKENKVEDDVHLPTEGIAIYFVLDQSGSMREEMGYHDGFIKGQKRVSRIDALKDITAKFIKGNSKLGLDGRASDLIGITAFARVPKILVPLTLDREQIDYELSNLAPVKYVEEEGTAIGYAIYKTAHTIAATEHFAKQIKQEHRPSYNIQNTIMILVTDGFQYPNHKDRSNPLRNMGVLEASGFAKEKGIRLYIIDVEPALDHPQYAHQKQELKNSAELTGGQFFLVSDVNQLQRIYKVIDQVEKAKQVDPTKRKMLVEEEADQEKVTPHYNHKPLFPILIAIGLALLLMAFILETTLLKKVP